MTETQIQADIMLAIGALPGVRIFRNNCGMARHASGAPVRYGVGGNGGSDLIGWVDGRFLAIEVKTPTGRTARERREQQQRFLDAVNADGGVAARCRSVEEALQLVASARDS